MSRVQDVLRDKGREVATIARDATVLAAAMKMNERRIGALVVMDGQRIVGIFTERDIMNRVVAARRDPATVGVGEVMTADIACCSLETTLAEARSAMTNLKIRHLPVVEGGELVGIVSSGDILARELKVQEETIHFLHEYMKGPN